TRVGTEEELDYRRALRVALARELHDGPMQELNACVMRLENFRVASSNSAMQFAITAVEQHVRAALMSLRQITRELRDEPPEEDVGAAILELVSRYRGATEAEVRAVISPAWPSALPGPMALHLVRIVQEAVNNAVLHARATHILIELTAEPNRLMAVVSDDGCGIGPGMTEGTGIFGMRERATILGGRLTVRPRHPGTTVRVEVPI
ncbi:MAG TPA: ATP-binding protein, partial [Candidatus Dormibacteraeota bacterium]|nr:ATP-binding protein [Candidatus Dormibacteraeota bacterium]